MHITDLMPALEEIRKVRMAIDELDPQDIDRVTLEDLAEIRDKAERLVGEIYNKLEDVGA